MFSVVVPSCAICLTVFSTPNPVTAVLIRSVIKPCLVALVVSSAGAVLRSAALIVRSLIYTRISANGTVEAATSTPKRTAIA